MIIKINIIFWRYKLKIEELLLSTQQPLTEYYKNKKILEGSRLFFIDKGMNERKIPKILTNSEKYHIVEIINYDKLRIVDNEVIHGNQLIQLSQCIDFDSNIMSYLRNLIVNNGYESDFFKILTNIKKAINK